MVREAATATFVRPIDRARSTRSANDVNAPPLLHRPPLTPGRRYYSIYSSLSLNKTPSFYNFSLQFSTSLYQTPFLHVDRHHYYYYPPNYYTLHNRNHGQGTRSCANMYPASTPLTRA